MREDFNDKCVIVAGAGKSGISSARLLLRAGAEVVLYDGNTNVDTKALLQNFSAEDSISIELGKLSEQSFSRATLFVISPGIPADADFVCEVKQHGISIWGEIELGYYFCRGKIAAITGTNGKTTTTTLVGEILKAYSDNTYVVGNIGFPFTDYADKTDDESLIAAEVSSFQLETIHSFRPHVSAVLNLTPDHLNRHYTFDNYVNAKLRVAENQTMDDYLVINMDDPETVSRCEHITNTNKVYFSKTEAVDCGGYVRNGHIYVRRDGTEYSICPVSDIKILGKHNLENVLAAATIAIYMDIPAEIIGETIRGFMGVEHRIEYVRTLNGVNYYNDSKGTNPDAAIKAVEAMNTPTILIGGGYDKKSTYDEWIESFGDKIKALVLIGETAGDIRRCCDKHGYTAVYDAGSLKEAVELCHDMARDGYTVLLSPACASWDMFKSYEERGHLFKEYVNELN